MSESRLPAFYTTLGRRHRVAAGSGCPRGHKSSCPQHLLPFRCMASCSAAFKTLTAPLLRTSVHSHGHIHAETHPNTPMTPHANTLAVCPKVQGFFELLERPGLSQASECLLVQTDRLCKLSPGVDVWKRALSAGGVRIHSARVVDRTGWRRFGVQQEGYHTGRKQSQLWIVCAGWVASTRWTGQIRCYWQRGARLRHNCKSNIWLILPWTNRNMHAASDVTVRGTGTSAGCGIYITFQ